MRTVLLIAKFASQFDRQVTRAVITYLRHHTDWAIFVAGEPSIDELATMKDVGVIGRVEQRPLMDRAIELGIPFVALGYSRRPLPVPLVTTDEAALGKMAADHLSNLGLRHFACVGHRPWPFLPPRILGFDRALRSLGHPRPATSFAWYYHTNEKAQIEHQLREWLIALPKPCGVLVATDFLAVEVVLAAQRMGLHVPDDLAVLGVDNDDIACAMSQVPLSSIVMPADAYGFQAARLLHEVWEGIDRSPRVVSLPPVRIEARASTNLIAVDDADVAAAIRLIRDHATENIDVAWIARQLPLSRRSLERKFLQITGQTLLTRIHHVRFDAVKQMLAETHLPLKLIAQRTGFVNAKWLSDSFRKYSGTTPTAYRSQFQPDEQPIATNPDAVDSSI